MLSGLPILRFTANRNTKSGNNCNINLSIEFCTSHVISWGENRYTQKYPATVNPKTIAEITKGVLLISFILKPFMQSSKRTINRGNFKKDILIKVFNIITYLLKSKAKLYVFKATKPAIKSFAAWAIFLYKTSKTVGTSAVKRTSPNFLIFFTHKKYPKIQTR